MQLQSLVAVDIGNSRLKLGRFDRETGARAGLPEPAETLAISLAEARGTFDVAELADWLSEYVAPATPIVIGSVSKPITESLIQFLGEFDDGAWNNVRQLAGKDFAIENRTEQPERVGIDRLAAAMAACAIRRDKTPAIVVDFGTAITVDLVSAEGAFEGGAILPGVGTSAEALHARTDALPAVYVPMEGKSPPPVGTNTTSAIHAGLYWGAVGAVRELIARQRDGLVQPPQVFVTGSTSPDMARLLGAPDYTVRYLPNLVLAGLALAAV